MRYWLAISFLGLSVASAVEPRDVVELAIKAHGGKEALSKAAIGNQKMSGTLVLFNTEVEFTGEVKYALPDKYKMTLTLSQPGQKIVATQIVNGDKVKTLVDGKTRELSKAQQSELKQTAANQEMSLLVGLLNDKKYSLKLGADNSETASVIVTGKTPGLAEVTLSFEKKSGQLVQMKREAIGPDDKPVTEETALSEFKKFGDVLLPTKLVVTRGGKKFMTMNLVDSKWLDKVEEKTFSLDD